MMLYALIYKIPHSSSIEIAVLGILIALLNLRSLTIIAKTSFLNQLRDNLLLAILPLLLVSVLIMVNHLVAVISAK
jgi:hypothetical protein